MRPGARSPSTVTRDLGVLPAGEHGERRPEVRGLAAERLRRRRSRAARPRRSCPRPRCWRTRRLLRRRPRRGRSTRPASIVRAAPPVAARRRRPPSSPAGCPYVRDEVPAGAARDDRELDAVAPTIPFTTSFTVPSPPTTTSSGRAVVGGLRARARRGGPGAPRSVRRPARPAPAARARAPASACRSPRSPEAGLTRKTTRSASAQCLVR